MLTKFYIPLDLVDFKKNFYTLIILNNKLPKKFNIFWQNANLKVCVDGGANRVFDFLQKYNLFYKKFFPDYIVGDFDSIKKNAKEFFYENKIKFIYKPDQNYNDFHKTLEFLSSLKEKKNKKIFVFGALDGRLDQQMANINTPLFFKNSSVIFIDNNSYSFWLHSGKHKICFKKKLKKHLKNHYCGLIPIGKKVKNISTCGLQWNLENKVLTFGGIISSSNKIIADSVFINTTDPVLFTLNFKF